MATLVQNKIKFSKMDEKERGEVTNAQRKQNKETMQRDTWANLLPFLFFIIRKN